jgi:hypothetical protein
MAAATTVELGQNNGAYSPVRCSGTCFYAFLLFLLKYFICFIIHSVLYLFYAFLQNIFNKKMQAARHKLPDKVYSKEFTSLMPGKPVRVKKFSETAILENIVL